MVLPLGALLLGRTTSSPTRCSTTAARGSTISSSSSALVRLTWQISPRNKLSALLRRDRQVPRPRHAEQRGSRRPRRCSGSRRPTTPAQVKWTSTVSSRLLLEGGWSSNLEYYTEQLPGRRRAAALHARSGMPARRGSRTTSAAARPRRPRENTQSPERQNVQASVSYVTGSHNVKVGLPVHVGRLPCTRSTRTPT